MTTPYDCALRIRRREVETVRVSISMEVSRLSEVEQSLDAVRRTVAREAEQAAGDPMVSTYAYVTRMRAERSRLTEDRQAIGAQLDRLRARAAAAYGSLSAIESAAEGFVSEQARAAASAEQSRSDDSAATAYFRARRAPGPR